eukprot:gene20155-30980_t
MNHELVKMKREAWWKLVGHSDIKKATKDATNSDAWGPSVEQLKGLSTACYVAEDRAVVMHNLWKRVEDKDSKNWRKIAKALVCLEYVILHGPEDVVLEVRSGAYKLQPLKHFRSIDGHNVDQGKSVCTKSEKLLDLVKNDVQVQSSRATARRTADRITATSSASPVKPSKTAKGAAQMCDEEIARSLQRRFDREASQSVGGGSSGLPHGPRGRLPQAHGGGAADEVELSAVDVAEQRRILERIQNQRSPTNPAPETAGFGGAVPAAGGGGYSSGGAAAASSTQWTLAPPSAAPQQPGRNVASPGAMEQQQQLQLQQQQAQASAQGGDFGFLAGTFDPFDPFAPGPASSHASPSPNAAAQHPQPDAQSNPQSLDDFFTATSPSPPNTVGGGSGLLGSSGGTVEPLSPPDFTPGQIEKKLMSELNHNRNSSNRSSSNSNQQPKDWKSRG